MHQPRRRDLGPGRVAHVERGLSRHVAGRAVVELGRDDELRGRRGDAEIRSPGRTRSDFTRGARPRRRGPPRRSSRAASGERRIGGESQAALVRNLARRLEDDQAPLGRAG